MAFESTAAFYDAYLACLNTRDFDRLGAFVSPAVIHNDRPFGLQGYRVMLEGNVRDIPDLKFRIEQRVCDATTIAARLMFDCHPAGSFLGYPINGRRVRFAENVFYALADGTISQVWSLVDTAAIETQLGIQRS